MTEEQLKDAWIDADAEAVIPVLLELQFNGLFGEFEQGNHLSVEIGMAPNLLTQKFCDFIISRSPFECCS
jgi:hypothetical protein